MQQAGRHTASKITSFGVDRTTLTIIRFCSVAKSSRRPPWKSPNPRQQTKNVAKKLTPAQKAKAKSRAKHAGRPYPNLVDNMRVAAERKWRKMTTRD
jgi:hypothetical protein